MDDNTKKEIERNMVTREYVEQFNPKLLFEVAKKFYQLERYQMAIAFISAVLQFNLSEIEELDHLEVYKLAYNIFLAAGVKKEANLYFDSAMNLEMRDHELLTDYPKFYPMPRVDGLNNEKVENPEWYLVMQENHVPEIDAVLIAILTGQSNNKDMVMFSDDKSYIVSARLLNKLGTTHDDFLLKEKVEAVGQVMQCQQAMVLNEQL